MTNTPIVPNYVQGVGQLVTYRADFEAHIIGTNFRHQANQIDMLPLITIGGGQPNNVQDAINALNNAVNSFTPASATTTSLGIVQLAGDLAGNGTTATTPRVSGLQGYPVVSTTPSTGKALIWSGVAWAPTFITLVGDVQGATGSNQVTAINGPSPVIVNSNLNLQSASILTVTSGSGETFLNGSNLTMNSGSIFNLGAGINGNIVWVSTTIAPGFNPTITQFNPTTDTATGNITIQASNAWSGAAINQNGGNITINTGNPTTGSGGAAGTLALNVGNGAHTQRCIGTNGLAVALFPTAVIPAAGTFAETAQTYYNWIGTVNTQNRSYNKYPIVQTTSTVTPTPILNFTLPNGTSVFIEASWIRRKTDASVGIWGGRTTAVYRANGGTVSGFSDESASSQFLATGTGPTEISFTAVGNAVTVKCVAPDTTTYDWQILISINYC